MESMSSFFDKRKASGDGRQAPGDIVKHFYTLSRTLALPHSRPRKDMPYIGTRTVN